MNRQMQGFVDYVRTEMLAQMQAAQQMPPGLVPIRRPVAVPPRDGHAPGGRKKS
jgi:MerR family transcriptional regulator, heat shock protein HspR